MIHIKVELLFIHLMADNHYFTEEEEVRAFSKKNNKLKKA